MFETNLHAFFFKQSILSFISDQYTFKKALGWSFYRYERKLCVNFLSTFFHSDPFLHGFSFCHFFCPLMVHQGQICILCKLFSVFYVFWKRGLYWLENRSKQFWSTRPKPQRGPYNCWSIYFLIQSKLLHKKRIDYLSKTHMICRMCRTILQGGSLGRFLKMPRISYIILRLHISSVTATWRFCTQHATNCTSSQTLAIYFIFNEYIP